MSELVVYRYLCPLCTQGDMGPSVGRCLHCGGAGLTNDVAHFPEHMIREAPVPPGVMRKACPDCAFRSGSPELEDGGQCLPEDGPFWCHHGTAQGYGGTHQPYGAWHIDGHPRDFPLGELLCAGWWAKACGRPLPTEPFRNVEPRKEEHA